MSMVALVVLLCIVCGVTCNTETKQDVYIAGLFPTDENIPEGAIGRGVRPAVELALQHINNHTGILSRYNLKMTWNDTKCDMAMATRVFFDMMDDHNSTKVILFGDACFQVTGPISQISKYWNMFQLSYADTNPLLSERDKYPFFFRTVPSDSDFNPARLALLRNFNWTRVGTLFQFDPKGSPKYNYAHNRLVSLLGKTNIQIDQEQSFAVDPEAALEKLKAEDIRIILGNFDESTARRVFCAAHKKQMYGARYQWMIVGEYEDAGWWEKTDSKITCTKREMNETVHGCLTTDLLELSSSNETTVSGLRPSAYEALYKEWSGTQFSKFHGYAYDGVWVIAKAIDTLLAGTNPDLISEDTFRGPNVGKVLNETNFLGVTGRVQFNNGDRLGQIRIRQIRDGKMVKIAEYHASTDTLNFHREIQWRGSGPPKDRNIEYPEMRRVSVAVYSSLCVLSALGIIMAVGFLTLNILYRRHRYIKMSSPNMNNLIIIGCILCYLSVFLLGTDGGVVSHSLFRYLCQIRAWVLALGFTLAFGAMFSKTWRVHAIFTNIKLNKKVIKDYKLFLIVCVLVLLDAVILVAWQVYDPIQRAEKNLAPEVYEDYSVTPVLEYCKSEFMEIWLGSIYAYKGLLLVFGCFLAWETRHVSIPALNDSKYIGMSVYNVVIMCVCGGAVSFLIKDQPNSSFIIISLCILFCTTITLCLVFMPKMITLRRNPKGNDTRVRATLKKTSKKDATDSSELQLKIRTIGEENRKLREILAQRASEVEHILEQLGEEASTYDLGIRSAVHKKVLELRVSDVSPSKISRSSSASEADCTSTYSEVSGTTSLWADSPPLARTSKVRLLTDRLRPEVIELADLRNKGLTSRTCNVLSPAEEEEDDDDPFGGVYLGPPETDIPKPKVNFDSMPDRIAREEHPTVESRVRPSCSRLRADSDVSSETDQDRSEPISVPSLQGITARLSTAKLGRGRRHSAPCNIWPITEASEETESESENSPQENVVQNDCKKAPLCVRAMDRLWAKPKLTRQMSPHRVTFQCDVLEDI
ncbi:gamma-aminobutyric acid type B receptor subunit 2-like [Haliotis asinina]|uniref:gamma-aminobutyric acid type B receptor subunit 2-like n=1 Tax=Haliotis asinina TaxID=109174 RepID=UPI0035323FB7